MKDELEQSFAVVKEKYSEVEKIIESVGDKSKLSDQEKFKLLMDARIGPAIRELSGMMEHIVLDDVY